MPMQKRNIFIYSIIFVVVLIVIAAVVVLLQQEESSTSQPLQLKATSFRKLPGWRQANLTKSLIALQYSCQRFLNSKQPLHFATQTVPLKFAAWEKVCVAASNQVIINKKTSRAFFQHWFQPYRMQTADTNQALFTGYYLPEIHASLHKHGKYTIPIYARPKNLIAVNLGLFNTNLQGQSLVGKIKNGRLIPYNTPRDAINFGALKGKAKILMWTNSRTDRFFLGIQGSGVAVLPNGKKLLLGYAAQNGSPYTAIGKILIQTKQISKDKMSMQAIRTWLRRNPGKAQVLFEKNASFIFFRIMKQNHVKGTENVPLTAGYSIAVDNNIVPLGVPIWLTTTLPQHHSDKHPVKLQRLMMAQDTGGAIRGPLRADIYWGAGNKAAFIAGHMKNNGQMWMLLPKSNKY